MNLCNLCSIEKQTIQHLMFECMLVRSLWMFIQAKFKLLQIPCTFCLENIMFNTIHQDKNHVTNLIVLIYKQYSFRCKCSDTKPNKKELLCEIQLNYRINLYNTSKESHGDAIQKIRKKWSPVADMFDLSS